MFRKIFIVGLVWIMAAAIAASAYSLVRTRPAQAASTGAAISQSLTAGGSNNPANGQTDASFAQEAGGFGQGGAGRGGGNGGSGGGGYRGGQGSGQALPPAGDLSAAEAQSLLFMIEEEKLARDVYQALFAKWSLPAFQNISQSEQTHMNSVQMLLDRYNLTSPVQPASGSFTDPALQSLYNELIARGSLSLAEAIKVGGLIEEIDILDLQERLAQTDNADIQQVYNNLLNGSYNHLRAFSNTLTVQTGETYQPQKLSVEAYQAILSGSQGGGFSRGNGRGQGAGGRGNGRGQGPAGI